MAPLTCLALPGYQLGDEGDWTHLLSGYPRTALLTVAGSVHESEKRRSRRKKKEEEENLLHSLLEPKLGTGTVTPSTSCGSVQSQGHPRFKECGNRLFLLREALKSHCRGHGWEEK